MPRVLLLGCAFGLLAVPAAYGEPIAFTLNPSVVAQTGGAAIYQGTITNLGTSDLFINDISINFTPPGGQFLTNDINFFFANVPGTFLPNESYTGPIFRITVAPNTPLAVYTGVVTLLGGAD